MRRFAVALLLPLIVAGARGEDQRPESPDCSAWSLRGLSVGMSVEAVRESVPALKRPGRMMRRALPDGAELLKSDELWAWFEDGRLVTAALQIPAARHADMRRELERRLGPPIDSWSKVWTHGTPLHWGTHEATAWASTSCGAAIRLDNYHPRGVAGIRPVVHVALEDLDRLQRRATEGMESAGELLDGR